jgi:5,10-methylenetetrahydromethanopterin reductase
MNFDVAFVPHGVVPQAYAVAEEAERLGFRCFWVADQGFCRDPFVILSGIAARCTTLELGVGITSPYTRLPVQIARAAVTLQEVTSGRFRLGLGTANVHTVLRPLGLEPGSRVGRLRDAIRDIRCLLAGEEVTAGLRLQTHVQPPVPIYLGTRGPKILELAGEVADGVLVESIFNDKGIDHVQERLEKGAARSGRTLGSFDLVSWQVVIVTDDPQSEYAQLRPWVLRTFQNGPPEALRMVGIRDSAIEEVRGLISVGDLVRAEEAIPDEAIDSLMIIGDANHVTERIRQVERAGATTIAVLCPGTYTDAIENLRRLAREVVPAFDTQRLAGVSEGG